MARGRGKGRTDIAVRRPDKAPYRGVVTHGWTLMNRAADVELLGNVVLPTEICDKWGADLLRLWVNFEEQADVKMSDRVIHAVSEYWKIRNTFRFALGNLNILIRPKSTRCRTRNWRRWISGCGAHGRPGGSAAANGRPTSSTGLPRNPRFLRGGPNCATTCSRIVCTLRRHIASRGGPRKTECPDPAGDSDMVFTGEEIWKV